MGRVAGSRDWQYLVLGHPGIVTFTVSARETEFVFSAGKITHRDIRRR